MTKVHIKTMVPVHPIPSNTEVKHSEQLQN
jgi:hypothetical protein